MEVSEAIKEAWDNADSVDQACDNLKNMMDADRDLHNSVINPHVDEIIRGLINKSINMTKAAKAGMSHYACADDWHRAIVEVAKANREPGETAEQVEARLTRDDPTVRQFDQMRREALAAADVQKAKGGRPRKYSPEAVHLSKAEEELSRRAMERAKAENMSFERAFVKEIDAPEGAELYRETRGAVRQGIITQEQAIEAKEAASDLFARRLYRDCIRHLDHLTLQEIADHLNEIKAPRLRGASRDWTIDAVSLLRARVATMNFR